MSFPITFGIELEFNLAYLHDNEAPVEPTETRQVYFHQTEDVMEAIRRNYNFEADQPVPGYLETTYRKLEKEKEIKRCIRNSLRTIADNVQEDRGGISDPDVWEVLFDTSVLPPLDTGYNWAPLEINSPALPFTPASLQLIGQICSMITETYVTDPNYSTGVHVHLAAGKRTFDFRTMQKLMVFFWAFENQMDSLHPAGRQDNKYCRGMREQSTMVADYTERWGKPPTIIQGIVEFLKCQNLESVLHLANSCTRDRYMSYNVQGALDLIRDPYMAPFPTIECRQHRGTLDGEEVVQWVKLLAGIVQSLSTIHPESFVELISLVQYETWEKTADDRQNGWNQADLGPIPAESTLTIIDILKYLGLNESADYYRNRLFPVIGRDKYPYIGIFYFDSEAHAAARNPGMSAKRLKADRRVLERTFQSMMLAGAATADEDGAGLDFNPDDPLWSFISRQDGHRHELSRPSNPDSQNA